MVFNGILTDYISAFHKSELMNEWFGGYRGEVIFSSSHGFIADGCSVVGDLSVLETESAKLGTAQILHLAREEGIREFHLYGESRGGAVIENTISRLPDDIKGMIHIKTQGSASLFKDDGFKSLHHYIDTCDLVPFFANAPTYLHARLVGCDWITFQKNKDINFLNAHDYFGEKSTYVKNYVKWGKDYVNDQRKLEQK